MPRSIKMIGFVLVTLFGAYGCAKGPGAATTENASASASVSAKVQRLEDDYRAAIAARDQFRQKLVKAEEKHTLAEDRYALAQKQFQQELEQTRAAAAAEKESLKNEKESLKNEVKARTGERDALNAQFETFRKNLKELLGSADSAVGALNRPGDDQGAAR